MAATITTHAIELIADDNAKYERRTLSHRRLPTDLTRVEVPAYYMEPRAVETVMTILSKADQFGSLAENVQVPLWKVLMVLSDRILAEDIRKAAGARLMKHGLVDQALVDSMAKSGPNLFAIKGGIEAQHSVSKFIMAAPGSDSAVAARTDFEILRGASSIGFHPTKLLWQALRPNVDDVLAWGIEKGLVPSPYA